MAGPDPFALSGHRGRLLEGVARAVAAKGYAATTIADIVREASVSRRTFYEHFGTKADCLAASFEATTHAALQVLRQAIDPAHPWQAQVEQALAAYLACIAADPVLLRTLYVEILGLGPEGLAARRRVTREMAGFLLSVVNGSGRPAVPLSEQMAMAVVGGIDELVLECIELGQVDRLPKLVLPAVRLVRAVTGETP